MNEIFSFRPAEFKMVFQQKKLVVKQFPHN